MKHALIAMALATVSALPAWSASITANLFDAAAYTSLVGAPGYTELATETFESIAPGQAALDQTHVFDGIEGNAVLGTGVGDFVSLGGTGSGGTVGSLDGQELAIRSGSVFGRSSTTDLLNGDGDTANDGNKDAFLDSNDTLGLRWTVDLGGSMFNQLVFVLTDVADAGASMTIGAGGQSISFGSGAFSDATRLLVIVSFDSLVDGAVVTLENSRKNDGFSIDDISVGVIAVPLSASALLLGAGLFGLAALKRPGKALRGRKT